VTAESSQAASAWALTWLWTKTVERARPQLVGIVLDGDRVQVDDAEERVALLLGQRVLAEASAVVSERCVARRLDAREDAH